MEGVGDFDGAVGEVPDDEGVASGVVVVGSGVTTITSGLRLTMEYSASEPAPSPKRSGRTISGITTVLRNTI